MKEQHRLLVTSLGQLAFRVGHEKGVAVVDWVSQLESKNGVCLKEMSLTGVECGLECRLVEMSRGWNVVAEVKRKLECELLSARG